jgi:cell wall-associated NlpC family hydrolase
MTDARLTPANIRVAASHLRGQVDSEMFVEGELASISQVVVDLCVAPTGKRARQLLLGADVIVYERRNDWAFVQSKRDSYVGYVPESSLAKPKFATHRVATSATHAYATESFKSKDLLHLPFGTEVTVVNELQNFFETPHGFIPKKQLRPLEQLFADPATVAQLYFGVPYLWGGNSTRGVDCSGLVQAAYHACGHLCAGDSDLQSEGLGRLLGSDEKLLRGDLIFWDGHVAMMIDPDTMIHANAHHMAVVYESLVQATLRVKEQGNGDVTARRRVL